MSDASLMLVSHKLCPYVQRPVILLEEKSIPYTRIDIDLSNKPDWFRRLSPLGKTPLLLVDKQPVFESAVICEYLNEAYSLALHPESPLERARHRSWIEFGSAILNTIAGYYTAVDESQLGKAAESLHEKFRLLDNELGRGPFFAGEHFSLVDAVYGPIFRYFDVIERYDDFGFFDDLENVAAWRATLKLRISVIRAVRPNYNDLLETFLVAKNSAISARIRNRKKFAPQLT